LRLETKRNKIHPHARINVDLGYDLDVPTQAYVVRSRAKEEAGYERNFGKEEPLNDVIQKLRGNRVSSTLHT
jgi:hypothetical protein